MIAFILIQKGAGATAGAAFGSGASGTVFGARGAGNFLSRTTWVLAALFCLISLSMAVIASRASITPETDLGVVASGAPTEEVADQAVVEPPVAMPANDASDVPSIDAVTVQPATEDSAGDLPVIDESSTVPAEETAPEDNPGGGS
ncbi:MAG: preprotein translocase subunit SecG [Xanthomonadales bacterium]|nr:preprotein translocase subunit SecG [Xanthomonadales bacterium]